MGKEGGSLVKPSELSYPIRNESKIGIFALIRILFLGDSKSKECIYYLYFK